MNELRFATHPDFYKNFTTEELRKHYLVNGLFSQDAANAIYTMHDRMIVMGINPIAKAVELPNYNDWTKSENFLDRREMGVINIGGAGQITVDEKVYEVANKDCLYIAKGNEQVKFTSLDKDNPAKFYINSCPAHKEYPTTLCGMNEANEVKLGDAQNANQRTIYQYIHEDGVQSCQLVMGFTAMGPGSIWNTYPPHTHHRRMEVYFYFDMEEGNTVKHFMGNPGEIRHLNIKNEQAVISPEWSIHSGAGTSNYAFVWGMAGENKAFTDMDPVVE